MSEDNKQLAAGGALTSTKNKKPNNKKRRKSDASSSDSDHLELKKLYEELVTENVNLKKQVSEFIEKYSEPNTVINQQAQKISELEASLALEKAKSNEESSSSNESAMDEDTTDYDDDDEEEEDEVAKNQSTSVQYNVEFPTMKTAKNKKGGQTPTNINNVKRKATEANKQSATRSNNNSNKASQKTAVNNKVSNKSTKNIPPIIVTYNFNDKNLNTKMFQELGHKNVTFRIVNKNVTHLSTYTTEDFNKLKIFLKNNLINFYSYTLNDLKPFSIVIKNLSSIYSKEEILEYLNDLNLNFKIINLTKLSDYKWLVQLDRESSLSDFKSIRYILNCKIAFENFNRNGPSQCKNCQRFSHVASNCNMEYRCVKCAESHGPGKCSLPPKDSNIEEFVTSDPITGGVIKKIGIPVKCANCGVEGHTANAKICPKRLEILKKIREKKDNEVPKHTKFTSSFINPNVSFASKFSTVPVVQDKVSNNNNFKLQFDEIDNDCSRLLGKDFLTCLNKIDKFSKSYSNIKNDEDKTKALFQLLLSLRLDD